MTTGTPEEKGKQILLGFGFDEFMARQVMHRMKMHDVLQKEPLGDAIGTVLRVLEEDCGWSLEEVHAAVEAMQNAGVVFRER